MKEVVKMAKLHFRYGTMNSGKSTLLMTTAYNYEEMGLNVVVLKPAIDTKGNDMLDSRIGLKRKVDLLVKDDDSIISLLETRITDKTACILVDESQFLKEKQVDELYIISKTMNIPVICYGLRLNFKLELFEGSKRLLALSDELEELPSMCSCGLIARTVARKVNEEYVLDGEEIVIDGSLSNVTYESLCGKCYLEKVKKIEYKRR